MDVIVPADFTFPDTERIIVLNSSYSPEVMYAKSSMMANMTPSEKMIFDTLVTANLFDGFFTVLNDSPNENLRNSEYIEQRESDTTDFLHSKQPFEIVNLCNELEVKYIISMEYYGFICKISSEITDWGEWQENLNVSYSVIWRIYSNKGEILDYANESDTLYWNSENELNYSVPVLTDAVREAFLISGEKYAKHISPYWNTISRPYYQIYSFGDDISLERVNLIELKSGEKKHQSFKACFNLAVISESEDKLHEAVSWLKEAKIIKESEYVDYYMTKLQKRIEIREKLDEQSGLK
jgi:hypothetical protein